MDRLAELVGMLAWMSFVVTGAYLTRIDMREHRLPNIIVLSAGGGGVLSIALYSALTQSWGAFGRAVLAAVINMVIFLSISVLGGMGIGDVKYAAVTGLYLGWLGWEYLWWGSFLAFAAAGALAVVHILRRRTRTAIAFGPFMFGGVIAGSLLSAAA